MFWNMYVKYVLWGWRELVSDFFNLFGLVLCFVVALLLFVRLLLFVFFFWWKTEEKFKPFFSSLSSCSHSLLQNAMWIFGLPGSHLTHSWVTLCCHSCDVMGIGPCGSSSWVHGRLTKRGNWWDFFPVFASGMSSWLSKKLWIFT